MHSKYLGSDLSAFGGALYLWTFHVGPGTEQENLRTFDTFLKNFYRTNKTTSRYSSMLSSRMFLNKKGVKLKGKAAQVKALGLPLLLFWEQNYNTEIEIRKKILLYLKLNVKCEKILECHKGDMFLGHLAFC